MHGHAKVLRARLLFTSSCCADVDGDGLHPTREYFFRCDDGHHDDGRSSS